MIRTYLFIISLFIISLSFCFEVLAAEVLQISNSSILLIGDHNRTYKVQLSCLEVDSSKEEIAIDFLRSKLPRHSRVNLRPRGSNNGILVAKVFPIGTDIDIGQRLEEKSLARNIC